MQKLSSVLTNESVTKLIDNPVQIKRQLIRSYAVAPGDHLSILCDAGKLEVAHWGFGRISNARILTVEYTYAHAKPSFRMSYRSHRCVALADSFYLWEKKNPKPQRLLHEDDQPLLIPALWREQAGRKEVVLVTRPARKSLSELTHQEPILMNQEDIKGWLDSTKTVPELINLLYQMRPHVLVRKQTSMKILVDKFDHKSLHKSHQVQPSLF